jgi:ribonuclease HII
MGPVVAAAVILPGSLRACWKDKVRDSKQLRPAEREHLYGCISQAAVAVGTGLASPELIDVLGIARAARLAMATAVEQLLPQPHFILIDYFKLAEVALPQKGITDGDSLCFSIACASIIAKVTRDRMVVAMDGRFPGYGFAAHKGYGTPQHLACLRRKGPCPLHRRSFRPVRELSGWGKTEG